MANFQYALSDYAIDMVHISVDDFFDINSIRRETGIEIDVFDNGDNGLGALFAENPYTKEV